MTTARRTRIVYYNHTGQVSGAERVLLNMLRVLDANRYEASVVCPDNGDLADLVKEAGFPCGQVPYAAARFTTSPGRLVKYGLSLLRTVASMRELFIGLDPDIIHANSVRAGLIATVATVGTGKKVVWHVHDTLPRHAVSTVVRSLAYLSRRTRVVAVSHSSAAAFAGSLRFGKRLRTIHNGVDLSQYPRKQQGLKAFRAALGVADDAFLVCALGQICARKGLLELLEAFQRIYARAPRMHLAIVGRAVFEHEEQYRDSLLAYAAATGIQSRVHFTGERADVSEVLQGSDLLVLNSHQEPFGLVLVEAMSSGTPVLATRVGGIPEIVTDGLDGWLVERGAVAQLADKMLEMSRDEQKLKEVADRAYRITRQQFSLDRFKVELLAFYDQLSQGPEVSWSATSRPALATNSEK